MRFNRFDVEVSKEQCSASLEVGSWEGVGYCPWSNCSCSMFPKKMCLKKENENLKMKTGIPISLALQVCKD